MSLEEIRELSGGEDAGFFRIEQEDDSDAEDVQRAFGVVIFWVDVFFEDGVVEIFRRVRLPRWTYQAL